MRTLLTDLDETRSTPRVLKSGTTLRGGQIRLGPTFSGTGLVTLAPGAQDVSVEDLELVGWKDLAPHASQPSYWPLRGFDFQGGDRIVLRGCTARYFVAEACYFRNCQQVEVIRCHFDRSLFGLELDWPTTLSSGVVIRDLTLGSMRGVPGHIDAGPSLLYPGERVGADGMVLHGWTDVTIERVRAAGEMFGAGKLVTCADVTIDDCELTHMMLSGACYYDPKTGISTQPTGYQGPLNMGSLMLRHCRLDPDLGHRGRGELIQGKALQVSFPSAVPPVLEDCTIFAPRQGYLRSYPDQPTYRHAPIQVATGASLTLRRTRFLDREPASVLPKWVELAGGTCTETDSTHERLVIDGGPRPA